MTGPRHRVSGMDFDEVSTVDLPANQHGHIVLAKRATTPEEMTVPEYFDADGVPVSEDDLELGDVVQDADGNLFQFDAGDDTDEDDEQDDDDFADEGELQEVGKAAGMRRFTTAAGHAARRASNAHSASQAAAHAGGGGFAPSAARSAEAFGAGRGRMAASRAGNRVFGNGRTARNRKVGAAAGAGVAAGGVGAEETHRRRVSKSALDVLRETLSKAATDTDRVGLLSKAVEDAFQRAEVAESRTNELFEIAKGERDRRLESEYISKAAEFNVPIAPTELGPVLMRMAETLSNEDCAVIAKALSSAGSMLFTEAGYDGQATANDPFAVVDQFIEGEIAKSGSGGPSKEQALTAFFDSDPQAYADYRRSAANA